MLRRDHNNERPYFGPPVPVVRQVEPPMPEPADLEEPIAPDQESIEVGRFDPDRAYLLGRWAWGHEFGVSWAAYVAGLGTSHRWTMKELHDLRFLRWRHKEKNLS